MSGRGVYAGTGGWHQGDPPDSRSIETGRRHGFDISGLRARKIKSSDFDTFDLIFAMDRSNLRDLVKVAPHDSSADIHLFMDFVSGENRDVPDPYYGDGEDFEAVARFLARTPSRLVMVGLDDVLGEGEQVNIPGTVHEHPNWRRKLPLRVEDLAADGRLRRIGEVFAQEGRAAG